ncbi:Na(+)-translocating NADH-quinone reductase subunit B [bioreactor metagenome]|jgi:Na+-transporting NADH:ubiquinone oxidoreductase subunit B|uniref:Na(+)-translocating NADH-quinone reductase subunit B n=1 Tax=bioreactor metagenome TaxID=1076179 RepID=A0A644VN21_9ZZZZ|nr:NADH:ubiquinone reductase (Na(+)-transporting) subunit B [Bacteroidales bacterium]MDD2576230.1 NADH:ubiquinone reductase (Na(+)-transporting) subunit B [Bacteroidales bacterium]MDD3286899.1 NADH:ubiquinone reductase (Na(+)-transporting) subunit B [Bacteroidales bacterium]NCC17717.1 NADH:ubiquinone reductase (Na(+)-transporting) subunit B [Bacteroidia bacterium]
MKFVRDFLDKIKPNFEKGGKFPWLHSTFDAFETFAFVPKTTTTSGAHFRDAMDMKRTMTMVILALMPALLFGTYNIGFQHFHSINPELSFFEGFWDNLLYGAIKILPIIVISYVVGLSIEFGFAQWRKHDVNEGFLVTGMLIPLVMPPDVPLWQVALATAFAVVIGKEVFGGTGMNFLNPALLARAFLFFAFPSSMSGDNVWIAEKADAFSGATPLAEMMIGANLPSTSFWDMLLGIMPGSIGETSSIAILLGAAFLLITGIGSWRIMLSVFMGGALMGLTFNLFGSNPYTQIPFYYHYVMGGFMFGAVFMATDPVTAAQTNKGKWIYGILIGVMAVLIRVVNPAYPEGMMLAILLLNVFAPLIDYYIVDANIRKRMKRWKIKGGQNVQ